MFTFASLDFLECSSSYTLLCFVYFYCNAYCICLLPLYLLLSYVLVLCVVSPLFLDINCSTGDPQWHRSILTSTPLLRQMTIRWLFDVKGGAAQLSPTPNRSETFSQEKIPLSCHPDRQRLPRNRRRESASPIQAPTSQHHRPLPASHRSYVGHHSSHMMSRPFPSLVDCAHLSLSACPCRICILALCHTHRCHHRQVRSLENFDSPHYVKLLEAERCVGFEGTILAKR